MNDGVDDACNDQSCALVHAQEAIDSNFINGKIGYWVGVLRTENKIFFWKTMSSHIIKTGVFKLIASPFPNGRS